jgi:hypothetical protein
LHRAIAGAIACGEEIDSDLVDRARILGAFLLGDPDTMDGDEVGFLGKLLKKAIPFATSFIPGVGPLASAASKGVLKAIPGGKKKSAPPPKPKSAVRALTKGAGKARPTPDTITHAPTGAVSVPIQTPAAPGAGPAMLYYHPANATGPVVMRF